jgi:hypothetical protein
VWLLELNPRIVACISETQREKNKKGAEEKGMGCWGEEGRRGEEKVKEGRGDEIRLAFFS